LFDLSIKIVYIEKHMNTKLELAILVFISITLVANFFWMIRTENRLKRFFLGKKGKNLEDIILYVGRETKDLKEARKKIEGELETINKKLKKSIRWVKTERFNPFADQGSGAAVGDWPVTAGRC